MNMILSTEPLVRRTGEASADGLIGLIEENKEISGY